MRKAQGLYIISVAAQILEMHPQTLRKYERAGFVEPPRMGTLRLYSDEDIVRLRLIKHLVDEVGLNLSGVEMALDLVAKLLVLRTKMEHPKGTPVDSEELVRDIDAILLKLGLKVQAPSFSQAAAPETQERPAQRR